ncbi:hypothetical protein O6H91_10G024400 [Diphasiastrum complanatum]|uniref:Uncharacterized protein n=2 Tax=Diphasiastrum complanatum TaxID=34168 RepID=A0ACC2CF42_DIPCM|nr:hypothetical protein O6H91_10G022000 [Diphasiastrum complanatum]KAJ7540644.1 hypothetical protein O6H91_10G024400 [Diphasiastrum complanatum]
MSSSASASKWWEVEVARKFANKGGAREWKRKFCINKKSGSTNTVRAHLLGEKGKEINACPLIPNSKRVSLAVFAASLYVPPTPLPLALATRTTTSTSIIPSSSGSRSNIASSLSRHDFLSLSFHVCMFQQLHMVGRQLWLLHNIQVEDGR